MRAMPMSTPQRLVHLGLVFLGGLGLLIGLQVAQIHLERNPLADVHAYYDAGARLNAGIPLYEQAATTNEAEFYRYPPLLAIAFRPLAALPFDIAATVWMIVVVATFVVTLWRLGASSRTFILVGLLGLPIGWAITIGQAHVPLTLLLLTGSPLAIALAANLKVLPALVAVWWIGRRDWRSLGRFLGWCVALGLLQLVLEPSGTLAFPAALLDFGQVGEVRNWSPYAISPVLWAVLVVVGTVAAFRLAPTRWGWAAAVALSVLATPRLLLYQLMALLAAGREPATSARDEAR
jgi:hypothetical protein